MQLRKYCNAQGKACLFRMRIGRKGNMKLRLKLFGKGKALVRIIEITKGNVQILLPDTLDELYKISFEVI